MIPFSENIHFLGAAILCLLCVLKLIVIGSLIDDEVEEKSDNGDTQHKV